MDKWERLNPGEEVDVAGGHDPADPRHDRAVRLRLPVQLLLPRHPAPVRRGDGAQRSRSRRPGMRQLPIQTRLRVRAQRQLEEDEAFMNDLVDRIIAERRARGRRGATPRTCSAACSPASTSRPASGCPTRTSGPSASPSSSPATRPPAGCCRSRSTTCSRTRTCWPAPAPRSTRCSAAPRAPTFEQVHRLRYVRQILDETLRLWPTAPGFTRTPVRGHRDRRPVRDPRGHPDHRADPGAAPRTAVWGAGRRGVQPRPHRRRSGWPRSRPTPTSRSAPGSGPASAASSPCRRPCWCSACCCSASSSSTTCDYELKIKTTLTDQARRASTSRSSRRPGVQLDRAAPGRRSRSSRRPPATAAPAPRGRPARHPAAGAVRLQPRHRRGDRHPARPGGHRPRLRRHPRRARRPRRATCPRDGAAADRRAPPTTARRRTTPAAFCRWISRRLRRCGRRASPTPSSAAATPTGPPTYQAVPDPARRRSSPRTAAAASAPRGEGDAARRLRRRLPRLARRALGRPRRRARTCPPRWARPRPRPGRGSSITLTNRQVTNPVIVSYRGPAGAGAGQPRAASRRERQAGRAVHPPPRDRAAGRDGVRGGRSPRGAAAQRHRPHPPGDGPLRARRRAVRHDHPEQRQRTPTCRSTSPPRCSACWAAASSCRTSRPATTSRRWPRHTDDPDAAGRARGAGRRRRDSRALPRAVLAPNRSLLDLLEAFPACALPFAEYLDMLPPLRPRYYSISSSPLASADVCSITVGVLRGAGPLRRRARSRRLLRAPGGRCRTTARSSRSSASPASRSGRRRTRTCR